MKPVAPRSILLLVLAMGLAACASVAPEAQPTRSLRKIRLPMGFIPNIQYAPFYMAVDRGYFAREGLEIEFDYSTETDGVALVGVGEVQFALASGEQVLLARAQGAPVVYVMAWFQDFPIAIAAPLGSGIDSPEELEGKKVGIPGTFGASYVGYRALLSAADVSTEAVQLESIGFNQVEVLAAGQADAVVVYANNEPIQLNARGHPVEVIRVSDYVELASNGLITNETTIEDEPELVAGVVRATLDGLRDAIQDPQAAYEVSKQFVEGLAEADPQVQQEVLARSIEFWQADRLGFSEPQAWINMHQVLLDMGLLSEPVDVGQAFTNEFVTEP